jgi:hypothetical protein
MLDITNTVLHKCTVVAAQILLVEAKCGRQCKCYVADTGWRPTNISIWLPSAKTQLQMKKRKSVGTGGLLV